MSASIEPSQVRTGLGLKIGPFHVRLTSRIESVATGIAALYADYPRCGDDDFYDFHVRVDPPPGVRGWYRPQVEFYFDERRPFKPLPQAQAFAFFEWGLNWCVANHMHCFLIVHSAVLEKNGRALVMPAPSGSGKSTLCGGLTRRGWRLLSDELAIIDPLDGQVVPFPRPVSLKNQSRTVMQAFAPDATFGPPVTDTTKGTVTHMAASLDSIRRAQERALPRWLIFPRYEAGAKSQLIPHNKGDAFMQVAANSFNYSVLHQKGFTALADLIDRCACYDFVYSDLDDAIRVFAELD